MCISYGACWVNSKDMVTLADCLACIWPTVSATSCWSMNSLCDCYFVCDPFWYWNVFYTLETLPRADGDVTVYLGSSNFPPTSESSYTHCKRISTTVTTALLEQTSECAFPVATEYIYIVANGAGPLSICNVRAMLGKRERWFSCFWKKNLQQGPWLISL